MFTGIITHTAAIKRSQKQDGGLTITFAKPAEWTDIQLGESIATNGVCLTVSAIRGDEYDCHLMPETLQKTSFGQKLPKAVNLERSLSVADRFGGHFVQGHVDGVGTVTKIDESDDWRVYVDFGKSNKDLVIYKGSITINGVSLTVAEVTDHVLCVALIPHTLEHTTLDTLKPGDAVNLEFDMIGKYVVNMMKPRTNKKEA